MAFYMWKCIPSGKNDWKRTIIIVISSQHRQHQSWQSNWNAKSKWNHEDHTDHKKGFPTWCCSIPRREWISNSKYPEDIILELCELVYRWISKWRYYALLFGEVRCFPGNMSSHPMGWGQHSFLESSYEPGVALHAVDFVIYENHSSTLSPTIRVQWEN